MSYINTHMLLHLVHTSYGSLQGHWSTMLLRLYPQTFQTGSFHRNLELPSKLRVYAFPIALEGSDSSRQIPAPAPTPTHSHSHSSHSHSHSHSHSRTFTHTYGPVKIKYLQQSRSRSLTKKLLGLQPKKGGSGNPSDRKGGLQVFFFFLNLEFFRQSEDICSVFINNSQLIYSFAGKHNNKVE